MSNGSFRLLCSLAVVLAFGASGCSFPHGKMHVYQNGQIIDKRMLYYAQNKQSARQLPGQTDTHGSGALAFYVTNPSKLSPPVRTVLYVGSGGSLVFEEQ